MCVGLNSDQLRTRDFTRDTGHVSRSVARNGQIYIPTGRKDVDNAA